MTRPTALLILLLSWAVPLSAADKPTTLNLNQVDIRAFIATVSEITGKNFIIDPRVNGQVTVVSSTPVSPAQAYDIFESVLKVHGYSSVPSGGAIKIVPNVSARSDTVPTANGQPLPAGDRLLTKVIQVEQSNVARLLPLLRPLVPQQAYLAAFADSNLLVITDSADNVARIEGIVRQIDASQQHDIQLIKLRHAVASELARTLSALQAPAGRQQGAGGNRIIADDRSNSLLLSGEPVWRQEVGKLVRRLDRPVGNDGNTEVIHLRHASAVELVGILRGVGDQQLKAAEGGAPAAAEPTRFDVRADSGSNALVVTAPRHLMQTLKKVVTQLDVRRAQVQIQAIIAELRYDKSAELGIEWQTSTPGSGDNSGLGAGTSLPLAAGVASAIASYPATVGSGLSLGYFRNGNLRALLKAFAGNTDTNILSTPSLVTLDNQQASIHVGQNVPFVTGQYTNGDPNAGTNPFQTIERQDVGIKLKVTPHISEGDTVRLRIEQEVSSVDSTSNVNGLVTNKRTIDTTVLVDDGQILVLGGLIQDELAESESRVPLLGDVPLVGNLFKSRRTTRNKKNLLVFLRPVIIRDNATANALSLAPYRDIRQVQQQAASDGVELMPKDRPPVLAEPPAKDEPTTRWSPFPAVLEEL